MMKNLHVNYESDQAKVGGIMIRAQKVFTGIGQKLTLTPNVKSIEFLLSSQTTYI